MKNKKHIGSSFESFLEEEGILEEVTIAAVQAVMARNLKKRIKKRVIRKISKKLTRCKSRVF